MKITPDKITIFNVKLDNLNSNKATEKIFSFLDKRSSSIVTTVNTEFVMRSTENKDFFTLLTKKSSLNLIDGSGIIWGYCLLNSWRPKTKYLKQIYVFLQMVVYILLYPFLITYFCKRIYKTSGADLVWDIAKKASEKDKSIFLLGNKFGLDPTSVEKSSLELQTKIFNLKIAGALAIDPNFDNKYLIEEIKKSGADIIYCALGSPAQEFWLLNNLSKTGAKVGIGLGGTLDFIAGAQKRAPKFIRSLGFEWLYRLIRQPRRIKRQGSLAKFIYKILILRLC